MQKSNEFNSNKLLVNWINNISEQLQLNLNQFNLAPLAGDASIRKYYLLTNLNESVIQPQEILNQYIVMQTPVNHSMTNFIKIADFLLSLNLRINLPKVLAVQSTPPQGFLLLNYLGEELLFKHLNLDNADYYYNICLERLTKIQLGAKYIDLPIMDRSYIKKNLAIFKNWYLEKHLNIKVDRAINNILDFLEDHFVTIFRAQPQTFVHVDYHSKNIILDPQDIVDSNQKLGILDFQDAMFGPITYDIVSLLQDAYIVLPVKLVDIILSQHHAYLVINHPGFNLTLDQFSYYFYLTGLQRHLKNLGVFARLKYFYHKPQYINYIPNLLKYINNTCNRIDKNEFNNLKQLLAHIDPCYSEIEK